MKTINKKPFRVQLAERLIKDQQELDHLAVQVSLGKAELRDEFNKSKADLKKNIHEIKLELKKELTETESDLTKSFDKIEEQLNEDVAYTKKSFLKQKETIEYAIDETKEIIKNSPQAKRTNELFNAISQKSRLQLELLEKNFSDKKVELTEDYLKNMKAASEKLEKITSKFEEEKEEALEKWGDFKEEVSQSFEHLKKAFRSL
ncbi:MAG: hypothetical protein KDC74_07495, partial [Flavobacteriaceae bacterium]|jgi:hypothetical protein|nr:hypothetical protein [Flavobacteriaceae bacterium]